MFDTTLLSTSDTLLYAVPMLGALLIGVFRLDEVISAPKRKVRVHQTVTGCDATGEPLFCDPDGRPWKRSKRPAKSAPPVVFLRPDGTPYAPRK